MPKKVTVDGVEIEVFLKEELQEKVETARKEEKDKLYTDLNAVKAENAKLKETISAEEKTKKEQEEKRKAEEATRKAEEDKKKEEEANKSKSEIEVLKTTFEKQLKEQQDSFLKTLEETQKTVISLTEKITTESLDTYKKNLISSANGKLIEELVIGNTKEELDASLVKAKEKYQEILKKNNIVEKDDKESSDENQLPTPKISLGGKEVLLTPEVIKNMSPEEYKKNAETIRKLLKL